MITGQFPTNHPTEADARAAGFTRAVMFESSSYSVFALVQPDADLSGEVLGWDNSDPSCGMLVIHGHMFDEVHDA